MHWDMYPVTFLSKSHLPSLWSLVADNQSWQSMFPAQWVAQYKSEPASSWKMAWGGLSTCFSLILGAEILRAISLEHAIKVADEMKINRDEMQQWHQREWDQWKRQSLRTTFHVKSKLWDQRSLLAGPCGDHMGHQWSNLGWPCVKQAPCLPYCLSSLLFFLHLAQPELGPFLILGLPELIWVGSLSLQQQSILFSQ